MEPNTHYTIRVSFDEVDYDNICDYYNAFKPKSWKPLRKLKRAEGGFCIERAEQPEDDEGVDEGAYVFENDPNKKIKQLRWHRKRLITPPGLYVFEPEEILLLYDAFLDNYEENEVFLESGKSVLYR